MRNKILSIALCTAGMIAVSSCSDYLETSSPSTITSEVAAASLSGCQTTLDGAYTNFHAVLRDQIFANGLFYTLDAAGSDIERHGGEQNVGRLRAETFYNGGNSDAVGKNTGIFPHFFSLDEREIPHRHHGHQRKTKHHDVITSECTKQEENHDRDQDHTEGNKTP